MGFDSNIGRTDEFGSWKPTDVDPRFGWSDPEKDPNTGEFLRWKKGDEIICDRWTFERQCEFEATLTDIGYLASPCRLIDHAPLGRVYVSGLNNTYGNPGTGSPGAVSGIYEGFQPETSDSVAFPIKGFLPQNKNRQFNIVPGAGTQFLGSLDLLDVEPDPNFPDLFVVLHSMWRFPDQIIRSALQFVVSVFNCGSSCEYAHVQYGLIRDPFVAPNVWRAPFYTSDLHAAEKKWSIRQVSPTLIDGQRQFVEVIETGLVGPDGLLLNLQDQWGVADDDGIISAPYRLEICCPNFCPPADMDVIGTVWPIQVINNSYPRSDRYEE